MIAKFRPIRRITIARTTRPAIFDFFVLNMFGSAADSITSGAGRTGSSGARRTGDRHSAKEPNRLGILRFGAIRRGSKRGRPFSEAVFLLPKREGSTICGGGERSRRGDAYCGKDTKFWATIGIPRAQWGAATRAGGAG